MYIGTQYSIIYYYDTRHIILLLLPVQCTYVLLLLRRCLRRHTVSDL